jgi:hypothetical protein
MCVCVCVCVCERERECVCVQASNLPDSPCNSQDFLCTPYAHLTSVNPAALNALPALGSHTSCLWPLRRGGRDAADALWGLPGSLPRKLRRCVGHKRALRRQQVREVAAAARQRAHVLLCVRQSMHSLPPSAKVFGVFSFLTPTATPTPHPSPPTGLIPTPLSESRDKHLLLLSASFTPNTPTHTHPKPGRPNGEARSRQLLNSKEHVLVVAPAAFAVVVGRTCLAAHAQVLIQSISGLLRECEPPAEWRFSLHPTVCHP